MMAYRLRCEAGHTFEGWFRSSADYDQQAARGLLSCPVCGTSAVEKAIMAPAVQTRGDRPTLPMPVESSPDATENPTSGAAMPAPTAASAPVDMQKAAQMLLMMKKLKEHVRVHAEDVGDAFPEEVRSMHYGETEHRDVYGQASLDEAKDLLDEGIAVLPLPDIPDFEN